VGFLQFQGTQSQEGHIVGHIPTSQGPEIRGRWLQFPTAQHLIGPALCQIENGRITFGHRLVWGRGSLGDIFLYFPKIYISYQVGLGHLVGAIIALHLLQVQLVGNLLLVEPLVSIGPLVMGKQLEQLIRHGQGALYVP